MANLELTIGDDVVDRNGLELGGEVSLIKDNAGESLTSCDTINAGIDTSLKIDSNEPADKDTTLKINTETDTKISDIDMILGKVDDDIEMSDEDKSDQKIIVEANINDNPSIDLSLPAGESGNNIEGKLNIETENITKTEIDVEIPNLEENKEHEEINGKNEMELKFPISYIPVNIEEVGKIGIEVTGTEETVDVSREMKEELEPGNDPIISVDLTQKEESPVEIGLNEDVGIELSDIRTDTAIEEAEEKLDVTVEFPSVSVDLTQKEETTVEVGYNGDVVGIELPEIRADTAIEEAEENLGVTVEFPSVSVDLNQKEETTVEVGLNGDVVGIELPEIRTDIAIERAEENLGITVETPNIELPNIGVHEKFHEPKPKLQINGDINTDVLKNADIRIKIDMDEINKNAVFTIQMPEPWTKEVVCANADPQSGTDLCRPKEKLNVEIALTLGKANLDDSEIYASINSKNILPRVVEHSYVPRYDIDRPLLTSKPDAVQEPPKRYDSRFQLPKTDLPSLSGDGKSPTGEASIVSATHSDTASKRFDFRFQLPKIELPFFGGDEKEADGESKIESNVSTADNESPPKRYDFRFQLPKIELPLFGGDEKEAGGEAKIDSSVNTTENESPPKRYDFRYQLPKVELSSLSGKPSNDDLKLDADSIRSDIESPNKRYDFRFQLPKIEFPSFDKEENPPNDNLHKNVAVDSRFEFSPPDSKHDYSQTKISDVKRPSIEYPTLVSNQRSGYYQDVDHELPGSDIQSSVESKESDSPSKRFDFRFNLPNIEFPIFVVKPNPHNAVSDIDLESNTSYINADLDVNERGSLPKRYDFRYKLPSIERPLFGGKDPSTTEEPPKRYDFRFKLPSIDLPIFGRTTTSESDTDNEEKSSIPRLLTETPFIDLRSLNDSDVDPKVYTRQELPMLEDNKDSIKLETDIMLNAADVTIDPDTNTKRYNFVFSFPEAKFRAVDGKVVFTQDNNDTDGDYNHFCLIFDGGDSDTNNMFEVQLANGLLKSRERYHGEWQPEINCTLSCLASAKNILVVFLPIGEDDLVILFNEEEVVKYGVKGCVNTLQSFTINGAVKLNAVKLCGE